ncbi:phage tail tape measure protein [Pseudomonas guariconensis]|uniref:phage tail tape measure protein n=1 Tax=Pseudomonas guariconensis TaxID=1288410 RepID=UPI0025A9CAFA|nr:phage tail tape measure protein [Pseudomonas guariconensis]MDM9594737.1 phage tail tape measure protein [Pseudomonas guariconensis]MDM9607568.1 phage tail tape measure protein [Pseudomonas guariconensis]MDM9612525.1 phage tail tape measure protein [Pseudomonas guariconensis]
MTNFAQLGIEVKSESAVQAADDLDRLVDSGKSAEDSAKRVGAAWEKAVSVIASDTSQVVQELKLLNARQDSTAQLMAKLAQSVTDASKAFTTASVGAQTMAAAEVKVGESAEQAKSRLLALATAAVDSAKSQETMSRAYEATAGSAAAAMRAQLDQTAAQSRSARVAATAAAEQEKLAAAERKATGATSDQAKELEKLLGAIDPAIAAFARLEKQQEDLAKFRKNGLLPEDDFREYSAKLDAARSSLGGFSDDLGKTGVSAKQTAAAMRMLPAQFSDIFVSLQGGQAPLTVFLQQGSQIKDSFGGIGAAAKAMAGYVASLVSPITVTGAALAALGVIYYDVEKEVSAFNKALYSGTGTIGLSVAQISAMATAIGEATGELSNAKEALLTLASASGLTNKQIENFGQAAAAAAEYTGQSAGDLAKKFSTLGDTATEAAQKASSQFGLVSASQYEIIKALDDQGEHSKALDALSEELNKNALERLRQYKESLSEIEKDWNKIGTAISNAYSEVKAELFPDLNRQIQILERIQKTRTEGGVTGAISSLFGFGSNSDEEIQKQLNALRLRRDEINENADQQAYLNKQNQDYISVSAALNKELENVSPLTRRQAAIDGLNQRFLKLMETAANTGKQSPLLAGVEYDGKNFSGGAYDKLLKGIQDRIKDSKGVTAPVNLSTFNEAENALKSLVSNYQNSMRVLDASLKAGVITQQDYTQQKSALIDKERTDVEEGYKSQITALQALADKSSTTGAQRIQIDQRIADTRQKMTQALQKLDADQQVLSLQSQERLAKETAAIEAYGQALEDNLKRTQDSLDLQLAGFGLGERTRQQFQEMLKIRQDYEKDLEKLERDHRLKRISDNEYAGQKKELEKWLSERLKLQEQYYADEDALRGDWQNGVSRAYNSYIEETKDIAGQTENLFSNALGGIEDAFVNLATEGKLSFKDLADSIIADLARIATRAYITVPLLSALGLGGSTPGGGGSILGGSGGGGGGLGLFDMASKAYGVATSGFGSAVSAGWSAGQGFLGGMQSAISGGYNYLSSGLSSLFSSGSAAAGTGSTIAGYTSPAFQNWVGAQQAAAYQVSGLTQGLSGIGGAIYGYGQSGIKGAVTGGLGGWGGSLAGGAAGTALGTAIGGTLGSALPGIGTAIGAALGSYLGGSLFGGSWQTKDVGLSLGVSNGDFAGRQYEYQKKKGGLFGKNKKRTRYSALDPETQAALDATYAATEGSVLDLFDRLNVELNDGVLDGLNIGAKKISTKDKTAEEIQAEIAKWFGGVADSMVSAVDAATAAGLGGYNFEGLTAFVQNLEGVNEVVRYLNVGMYDMSVAGGKLAEQLTAIAGGLDVLQSNAATYYGAFIGESERMDDTLDAVTRAFVAANQTLPETRTGFRDMVESIDTTTQAGMQMFSTLMALSGQAATYYDILEQRANAAAVAAAQSANDRVNAAFAAIQRAVAAQQKAINKSLTDANSRISDLTGISNALDAALKKLRGTGDDAVRMLRSQAQATLQSALAIAKAGGSLSGFAGLTDALDVLGSNNTDLYGSLEEFNRDQGRTANAVAELNKLNGKQLSAAEKSALAMQAQLDALDAQLEFAQAQVDALNGIDNSVKSVADAVKEMNAAVVAAIASISGKSTPQNAGVLIDTIYKDVLGRPADAGGKQYWQDQLSSGSLNNQNIVEAFKNAAAVELAYKAAGIAMNEGAAYWNAQLASGALTPDQLQEAVRNAAIANGSIPAYASGGLITGPGTGTSDSIIARLSNGEYVMSADAVRMFGTGLLDQMNAGRLPAFAQGGPVLDIPSPNQVFGSSRADVISGGSDNGALLAKFEQLLEANKSQRFQIAKYAQQVAQLLQKWDVEGAPKERDYA